MEKTPSCRVFIEWCCYITEPYEAVYLCDLGVLKNQTNLKEKCNKMNYHNKIYCNRPEKLKLGLIDKKG